MYAKDAIRCAKDAATCNKVAVTCAYVPGFVRPKRDRFASALKSPRFPLAFPSEPGCVVVRRTEKVLHSGLLASNCERMPAAALREYEQ